MSHAIVDVHAHVTPRCFSDAVLSGSDWHGMTSVDGELHNPMNRWSLEQRVEAMDADGIDVQLTSPTDVFYQYHRHPGDAAVIARDVNDEVAEMVRARPRRIAGLATVPMQDTDLAVAELTRAVVDLGLRGVMIDDHVNGETYDAPRFDAFWEAAEELGALILVHQYAPTSVESRIEKYFFFNSIGNLVDRTITFGALVYGGVMDRYPDLKVCLGHGGGYTAFALDRMDQGWRAFPDMRGATTGPPSTYARRFIYDAVTYEPRTLRYLVDVVGADRVVLGTDWPAPMRVLDPVTRLSRIGVLTEGEIESILRGTAASLLGDVTSREVENSCPS
ncbi:amidohydrolase family protein [Mycobacterium sp. 236(2023)]|uniref:amidohydrolase family protein n=1 Tax=Mycobacterium sp. 236(2023) TaxID=3038163 RepID=UPI0024153801|nr:amidohydrolase family protein [Mycobacterium sp. 236(2023)]MDG4663771.1 amidohydrolase family protein [Mycobacterium sp. 236(2023)]